MKLPRSVQNWMRCLTILFALISISAFSGVVVPPVWFLVMLPSAVLFTIVTIGMVLKFTYVKEEVANLRALNCLYQMERETK